MQTFVTTKIVFDSDGFPLLWEGYEYPGPWGFAKGGSATDQSAAHSSLDFMKTLQSAFSSQFGNQQHILSFLTNGLMDKVAHPEGYGADALTALKSSAINQNATDVANAQQSANLRSSVHGGNGLPSGVNAQIAGEISSAGAGALSGDLNKIAIANEDQKQKNYWNAVGSLSGVANMENPLGYAGAASTTGNSIANISQASSAADAGGFMDTLSGSFAGALGKTLGGGFGGSLFGQGSKSGG